MHLELTAGSASSASTVRRCRVTVLAGQLFIAGLIGLPMSSAGQGACRIPTIGEFGGSPQTGAVPRRPEVNLLTEGTYCLREDAHQRKLLDPRNGEEMRTLGGNAVILLGADDIRLDLGGHKVSNERALGYTLVKHYRYEPGRRHTHWFRRTHIRNGSLLSPGSKGIGLGLTSAGMYGPRGFGSIAAVPAGQTVADTFAATGHLVESLEIRAGYRGILIDGKNNVIRNNRIIVDSATAIVAQGPGVVIENNVIEVRNDLSGYSDYARSEEWKLPFPIRLIQADGAIVRNNLIRVVAPAARGPLPAAVELLQSTEVLVEANRLEGFEAAVRSDPVSTHRDVDNRLDPCGARAVRFLAPDERAMGQLTVRPACR